MLPTEACVSKACIPLNPYRFPRPENNDRFERAYEWPSDSSAARLNEQSSNSSMLLKGATLLSQRQTISDASGNYETKSAPASVPLYRTSNCIPVHPHVGVVLILHSTTGPRYTATMETKQAIEFLLIHLAKEFVYLPSLAWQVLILVRLSTQPSRHMRGR